MNTEKSISGDVHVGWRSVEERAQKIEILRKALEEGRQSGIVTDFNPEDFLEELHQSK